MNLSTEIYCSYNFNKCLLFSTLGDNMIYVYHIDTNLLYCTRLQYVDSKEEVDFMNSSFFAFDKSFGSFIPLLTNYYGEKAISVNLETGKFCDANNKYREKGKDYDEMIVPNFMFKKDENTYYISNNSGKIVSTDKKLNVINEDIANIEANQSDITFYNTVEKTLESGVIATNIDTIYFPTSIINYTGKSGTFFKKNTIYFCFKTYENTHPGIIIDENHNTLKGYKGISYDNGIISTFNHDFESTTFYILNENGVIIFKDCTREEKIDNIFPIPDISSNGDFIIFNHDTNYFIYKVCKNGEILKTTINDKHVTFIENKPCTLEIKNEGNMSSTKIRITEIISFTSFGHLNNFK